MASFLDQLRPASFRGIAFSVPADDAASGRRVVTHVYPGKDEPSHEDMGAAPRQFNVSALIHGADFVAGAAAFEAALNQPGPGRLIHPYYGDLDVVVLKIGRRHDLSQVGQVEFSVTFEIDKAALYPTAAKNTASELSAAADSSFGAIASDFVRNFVLGGQPDFLASDALARVDSYMSRFKTLLNRGGLLSYADDLFPSFADPESLIGDITGLFRGIADTTAARPAPVIGTSLPDPAPPADAVSLMRALTGAAAIRVTDPAVATIPVQATRIENAAGLDMALRGAAVSAAVQAGANAVYESREEALAIRTGLGDAIGALYDDFGAHGWDDSGTAAANALSALSRDINERIGRLPRTVTFRPAAPVSSLVLANRLYGDDPAVLVDQAADLVTRNRIRNPGFVPPQELEVLIDA